MKNPRSSRIVMTNENRVLRDLRTKHRMTMMTAAKAIGCSDSFISHVESGRVAAPQGERLMAFLNVYGGISGKYYRELVREKDHTDDDLVIVDDLLPKLNPEQLKTIRVLVEQFLSKAL